MQAIRSHVSHLSCCRDLPLIVSRVVHREVAQSPIAKASQNNYPLSSAQKPRGKQEKTESTKIRKEKEQRIDRE